MDKISVYLGMKDYKKAQTNLEEVFEIKPKLKDDINMMILYAQLNYENKNIDKSKELLKENQKREIPEDSVEKINDLAKKLG